MLVAGCGAEDAQAARPDDEQVDEIVDRLNRYWAEAADDLGFEYEAVDDDRISTGDDGVTCNGEQIDPEELADNAFVDAGCEEGILVAYDPDYLDNSLATMEGTLSHEWGHVIQAQAVEIDLGLDADGLPIDSELQADCFSGAWAAEDADATIDALRADLIESGDPGDVAFDEEDAHGSGTQRRVAFDLGYSRGPLACIDELIEQLPG